ncbi:MAG: nicotinate-nucleotide adenylyltransferase [Gammaproteobacteria bacterium]|nr:nicotinate-nucleotide adenylyltransferase [Gammaproteobacteria bacterium]
MRPIGIFGGTFDPIHYGHLRTAFEVLQALRFREVRFVPSAAPPHRDQACADARLRLEMVQVAVRGQPGFVVDDCEFSRDGPSYTVDTLTVMREEHNDAPLGLIVGMDAFLGLTEWHRWDEILQLAHIIVAHRPGWQAPQQGDLGELIGAHQSTCVDDLQEKRHGLIHIHAVTQLEIASTEIRELVATGRDPRFLMPDAVRDLIVESGCYK